MCSLLIKNKIGASKVQLNYALYIFIVIPVLVVMDAYFMTTVFNHSGIIVVIMMF